MPAQPPNPPPFKRAVLPNNDGTGTAPVRSSGAPAVVVQTVDTQAWEFKPETLTETFIYNFVCSSCTGLAPFTFQVPMRLFVEAVAGPTPENYPVAQAEMQATLRGLMPSEHGKYFNRQNVLDVGDRLFGAKKIPFNPFRPGANQIRINQAQLYDTWLLGYKKALTPETVVAAPVAAVPANNGQPLQGVQSASAAAPVPVVKPEVTPAPVRPPSNVVVTEQAPVNVSSAPVEDRLTVRATLDRVGTDSVIAAQYLAKELSEASPRQSLVGRLNQIIRTHTDG